MQQLANLCFGAIALVIFPYQIRGSHYGDFIVLIGNVETGKFKVGELTTFHAEVALKPDAKKRHQLIINDNFTFEFSWKVSSRPWVKHERTMQKWDNFEWRWIKAGDRTVFVYVRILYDNRHGRYSSYYATNKTEVTVAGIVAKDKIIATLDAYQSVTGEGNQDQLYAGTVTLEVTIHNFPYLELNNVTYNWNFGDGTKLTRSHLQKVVHNFTTVKSCTIVAFIHGWIEGKFCKGRASKTLEFKADIHPYLVIKSSSGLKLPSDHRNSFPTGSPLEFEVKFKDPLNLVTEVSTDWRFSDGCIVEQWHQRALSHTFHKEGTFSLWLTVRVNTKFLGKRAFAPIFTHLYVKDPVYLKVRHRHIEHRDKTVRFNISCNGSLPVSFHWCVSKHCHLPPEEICSPMMEHKHSCSLIVNHKFDDPGKYCVNIGVRNDVSGTNTSFMVQIPGGDVPVPKHSSNRKASLTGILVALFVLFILMIIVAMFVARKWIYSKREKTERADFDFRDEDALSVSSVELYGRRTCFGRCRPICSFKKNGENTPLFRDTHLYTL